MSVSKPPKEEDKYSLGEILETTLENILGQNYVDEYSGSDRHIGVDEIARQLAQSVEAIIKTETTKTRIKETEDALKLIAAGESNKGLKESFETYLKALKNVVKEETWVATPANPAAKLPIPEEESVDE